MQSRPSIHCLVALAAISTAAPAAAAPDELGAWLDVGSVINSTAILPPLSGVVGAGIDARWAPGFEAGAGLRWSPFKALTLTSGAEAFGAVTLAPAFNSWRPAIGLEAGLSSMTDVDTAELLKSGLVTPGGYFSDAPAFSPFYAAITAKPLRFRLGTLTLSALAFAIGTHWPDGGRVLRIHVIPLQAGWRF